MTTTFDPSGSCPNPSRLRRARARTGSHRPAHGFARIGAALVLAIASFVAVFSQGAAVALEPARPGDDFKASETLILFRFRASYLGRDATPGSRLELEGPDGKDLGTYTLAASGLVALKTNLNEVTHRPRIRRVILKTEDGDIAMTDGPYPLPGNLLAPGFDGPRRVICAGSVSLGVRVRDPYGRTAIQARPVTRIGSGIKAPQWKFPIGVEVAYAPVCRETLREYFGDPGDINAEDPGSRARADKLARYFPRGYFYAEPLPPGGAPQGAAMLPHPLVGHVDLLPWSRVIVDCGTPSETPRLATFLGLTAPLATDHKAWVEFPPENKGDGALASSAAVGVSTRFAHLDVACIKPAPLAGLTRMGKPVEYEKDLPFQPGATPYLPVFAETTSEITRLYKRRECGTSGKPWRTSALARGKGGLYRVEMRCPALPAYETIYVVLPIKADPLRRSACRIDDECGPGICEAGLCVRECEFDAECGASTPATPASTVSTSTSPSTSTDTMQCHARRCARVCNLAKTTGCPVNRTCSARGRWCDTDAERERKATYLDELSLLQKIIAALPARSAAATLAVGWHGARVTAINAHLDAVKACEAIPKLEGAAASQAASFGDGVCILPPSSAKPAQPAKTRPPR